MAGSKKTLKNLYEEFETFKDKHEKEISELLTITKNKGQQSRCLRSFQYLTNQLTIARNPEKLTNVMTL